MTKNDLFKANNISLKFDTGAETVTAVKKGGFAIPEGGITIIFGPSGSGKSSMLNILSGLQPPTTGVIEYRGKDMYDQDQDELAHFRAHEIGIVYQTSYWVKSLTVLENVAMPLYLQGFTKIEAHKKALAALERTHMAEYANKYPMLLSGGEQQRIAMARAVIHDSPVVIADEPTGNLDSKNGDEIISLLVELHEQYGKTIVLVTHNMEYLPIADHLLNIQDGTITEIAQRDIPGTVQRMMDALEGRIDKLMREDRSS